MSLKNWKTHLDSKIEFVNGTNAIIGNVGTGKSSILDAICFGFFGTFPNLQSKRVKLDETIMRRPTDKNKAEVQISFFLKDKNYVIKRTIEKNKGTSYSEIREDGKLLETNTSRVTEMVEKILKTNYETFSKAIYSEQNNLDYFLTLGKGQRVKKIDEMLMIDKFENVRANSVNVYNKLNDKKSALQSAMDRMDFDDVEKKVKDLKESVYLLEKEKIDIKTKLDSINDNKGYLEKNIKIVNEVKKSMEMLNRDKGISISVLEDLSKSIAILEEDLSGKKKVDSEYVKKVKSSVNSIESNLKELNLKRDKLLKSLAEKESMHKSLEETMRELSYEVKVKLSAKEELDGYKKNIGNDIEKEMQNKNDGFKKIVYDSEYTRSRIKDLDTSLNHLSQISSKCPICEKRLDEKTKKILAKNKKEQIENLAGYLLKVEKDKKNIEREMVDLNLSWKKIQQLEIKVGDYQKMQKDVDSKKDHYEKLWKEIDSDYKNLRNVEKDLSDGNKELRSLRLEKEQLDSVLFKFQEMKDKKLKRDEIIGRMEKINSNLRMEGEKLEDKNVDALEKTWSELLVKEAEYRTRSMSMQDIIKEKSSMLSQMEKEISTWKSIKDDIKRLDKILIDLKVYEKAIAVTQEELRKQFVEAVNYTINQLWSTLYPYQDFTEVKLHVEDGDYTLKLLSRGGVWNNADGGVSGGERSIACLALRVALALTLAPHLRLLILDEPSHNLDAKALTELATTLRERVGDFMDQVILITHEEELEESATGNVYRLERDKISDGVTNVIQVQ